MPYYLPAWSASCCAGVKILARINMALTKDVIAEAVKIIASTTN
jgi:hypothetical protein